MTNDNEKKESKEVLESKLYEGESESLETELEIFGDLLMKRCEEYFGYIAIDYERLEDIIQKKGMEEKMRPYLDLVKKRLTNIAEIALEISENKDYFSEKEPQKKKKRLKGVPYEGLFGLEDKIDEFEDALLCGENVILYGPPGCGKSEILRGYVIKHQDDTEITIIKQKDVLGVYVGESEKAVNALFEEVEKKGGIIVLDEGEWLFEKRRDELGSRYKNDMVSAVLAELDGLEKNRNVRIVVSTNRPDMMDPAFLRSGRFDTLIEIPAPDDEARKNMLNYNLNKMVERGVLDNYNIDVETLVKATNDYNAADIVKGLCYKLSKYCIKNKIKELNDKNLCVFLKEKEKIAYERMSGLSTENKEKGKIPMGYA